jgi:hypothetical protein
MLPTGVLTIPDDPARVVDAKGSGLNRPEGIIYRRIFAVTVEKAMLGTFAIHIKTDDLAIVVDATGISGVSG